MILALLPRDEHSRCLVRNSGSIFLLIIMIIFGDASETDIISSALVFYNSILSS